MKIFVMVDMEGISGIYTHSQVTAGGLGFEEARDFLNWDVNACVDGCFEGGATKVIVREAHGAGSPMKLQDLDPRAEYIRGATPERMPGIKGCDGLILLGYHAMAGTRHAILEHTMSSKGWQNFWLNGKLAGEIAIDAAIGGDNGVPTIMVSGDDKTCKEARATVPGIVTAQVKKGLGVEGGILLPPEKACDLIAAKSAEAVGKCSKIKPYKVRHPAKARLELVSRHIVPETRRGVKVIDGRTYEVTGRTVEEALEQL